MPFKRIVASLFYALADGLDAGVAPQRVAAIAREAADALMDMPAYLANHPALAQSIARAQHQPGGADRLTPKESRPASLDEKE